MTVVAGPGASTKRVDPVRTDFHVTVSLAQGTPAARELEATIAGWVFVPRHQPGKEAAAVWYLGIPGASYRGLAYFDRQVEGYPAEEFSIARFLAKHGIGLVVIDTLGTGQSEVAVDGRLITRFVTAQANAQVLDQIRTRLLAGMLVPELDAVAEENLFLGGFGHSMGSMQLTQLAALLEDSGTPLDAAIFAGWSHGPVDYARLGLDETAIFTQVVTTNGYDTFPSGMARPMFYGPAPTVPAKLIEVDEADAVPTPNGLSAEMFIPGSVAREAGTLSCPILYVVAAHDLCTNAQAEGAVFHCTRLFTAYTQPAAAHCNFEDSRQEYWRLIVDWSRMVTALGHPIHPLSDE